MDSTQMAQPNLYQPSHYRVVLGVALAGAIITLGTLAFAASPTNVLFVANGYFAEESDIYNHLLEINAAGDVPRFDITVKKDYQIRRRTSLDEYDLIIITGFAPNIARGGLRNIKRSGKPVFVIEYWDFWYSFRLGLVRSDWAGYYGTDKVEFITNDHPITARFEQEAQVYDVPWAVMYGIPSQDIVDGVTPLAYSSRGFDEVTLLVDDERRIATLGVYDTTHYLETAWTLFDAILEYVSPLQFDATDPAAVNRALAQSGVLDFVEQVGLNPGQWSYESAARRVWTMLVAANLTFLATDINQMLKKTIYDGRIYKPYYIQKRDGWTILALMTVPNINLYFNCDNWESALANPANRRFPDRVTYEGSEWGGMPVINFRFDGTADHPERVFGESNQRVAVTLGTSILSDFWGFPMVKTGTSHLLDMGDIYDPCTGTTASECEDEFGHDDQDRVMYWGGTKAMNYDISEVYWQPYDPYLMFVDFMANYVGAGWEWPDGVEPGHHNIYLDYYLFWGSTVHGRDEATCVVRFWEHPYSSIDSSYEFESFVPEPLPLPVDPTTTPDCSGLNCLGKWPNDECEYDDPFNPFLRHWDAYGDPDPDRGLPNVFMDAAHGGNYETDETTPIGGDLLNMHDLTPRMQLVAPSNSYANKYNVIEQWCEANTYSGGYKCDFSSTAYIDEFKDELGFDELYPDFDPTEQISPRHRTDAVVPWGGSDGSGDVGPWRKPWIAAGMETKVAVMVRTEPELLPDGYHTAFCDRENGKINGALSLAYCDSSSCDGSPITNPDEWTWVGNEEDPDNPVGASCFPVAEDSSGMDDYGVDTGQGLTYLSVDPIHVPKYARGAAYIVFEGEVHLSSGAVPTEVHVKRAFPVYIDPIENSPGTQISDDAQPSCWVGATRQGVPAYPVTGMPAFGVDFTVTSFLDFLDGHPLTDLYQSSFDGWLNGGDEGPWMSRVKRDASDNVVDSRLYSMYGDVGINGYWKTMHRGSGLALYHPYRLDGQAVSDIDGYEWWNTAAGDDVLSGWDRGYPETACPMMFIEGANPVDTSVDAKGWVGYPWEMTRAQGFDLENGRYVPGEIWCDPLDPEKCTNTIDHIYSCQQTEEETAAAVSGFQFESQEQSGDSYVWFGVATDWGAAAAPGIGDENAAKFKDSLTGYKMSKYLYNYNVEFTPAWYSFLTKWDYEKGIDDLGRKVTWKTYNDGVTEQATTFLFNSAVVFENLWDVLGAYYVDGGLTALPAGTGGILVWHSGRYKSSPIYLSYAKEADVLRPELYKHFTGFHTDGKTSWSSDEADAVPIIWDEVGELSAIYHNDGVFEPYKVLYSINYGGQQGIVMRTADKPWGPYTKSIPIFDCNRGPRELREGKSTYVQFNDALFEYDVEVDDEVPEGKFRGGLVRCYGGFTHPDLWQTTSYSEYIPDLGDMVEIIETTLRFNVSMQSPYKVLLVESKAYKINISI